MTLAVRLLAAALFFLQVPRARVARPLPDPQPFFEAVRANLARSQDEQNRFSYKERRTELDMNPFGHIGTGEIRVIAVTPVEGGKAVTRQLIERDGKPVVDSPPSRREIHMTERGKSVVEDVAALLDVHIDHRATFDSRDAIVVTFTPKRDAKPRTREGRLARQFAGEIWIDEQAREVVKVDAKALDDLSFGYGVLGRVNKGATVTVGRQRIDGNLWLPVSIRFDGEGRALLFRKLTINFALDWFDYQRVIQGPS
jgi:hypothetical protein